MKKILAFFIGILILSKAAAAEGIPSVDAVISTTAQYIYTTVPTPTVSSVGGEWAVFALSRSGEDIPAEYFEKYYENLEKTLKANNGILHGRKYTEYARAVIALTATGKNPENTAGYNLLAPLGDYTQTIAQGINGAAWAIIAFDCGDYEIPQSSGAGVSATRDMYIEYILENQCPDGGWSLSGSSADADITGMVLQALSSYQEHPDVKAATDAALARMSELQQPNGGFASFSSENSESTAQMITALCELGISPVDSRFTKNGITLIDNLMSYKCGNGFMHTYDSAEPNLMATEQCLYALVAFRRYSQGKESLYTMSDVSSSVGEAKTGLTDKHPDVTASKIIHPQKTFADIKGHINQSEIESMAKRGIINGKSETDFEPYSTMTRAEFATIITRGLGLPQKNGNAFSDTAATDWFCNFVNTACSYGIINGVSDTEFNPSGTITREEAAVMVARAAVLCGMYTKLEEFEIRNTLAVFPDYTTAADWAKASLAFCYNEKILSPDVMEIKPKQPVNRGEIASMLYNLLNLSNLIQE